MWPKPHKHKGKTAPAKTRKVCMSVTASEEEFIKLTARSKGLSVSDHLRQSLKGEALSVQEHEQSSNGD